MSAPCNSELGGGSERLRAFAFCHFRAGLEKFNGVQLAASFYCCYANNMPALLIQKRRYHLAENRLVDVSIWELPTPLLGCTHRFKYRLALVINGVCVLRYDNEAGKGGLRRLT